MNATWLLLTLAGLAPQSPSTVDGKVSGLPAPVFATLQTIQKRNPGSVFAEPDALALLDAIRKDGVVDAAERDLLAELTQARYLPCTVSGDGGATLTFYTQSGSPRKRFLDFLYPKPDFEAAWKAGADGFRRLGAYYGVVDLVERNAVQSFVEGKLEAILPTGDDRAAFGPLERELKRLHAAVDVPGEEGRAGRELLHRALSALDRRKGDRIPDELYSWIYLGSTNAAPSPNGPLPRDGKVSGLSADAFGAFQAVRKRNPGSFTEADARELVTAIQRDGRIDDGEADLLSELTQSQFRSIAVTSAADATAKVVCFPTVGNAKKHLQAVLNPALDLDKAWADGATGFREIVAASRKSPEEEARTTEFVVRKLKEKWTESNQSNGYKPLRDQLGKLYGYANSSGNDTTLARGLVYKAMNQLDRSEADRIPDFLYNWIRPGGFL